MYQLQKGYIRWSMFETLYSSCRGEKRVRWCITVGQASIFNRAITKPFPTAHSGKVNTSGLGEVFEFICPRCALITQHSWCPPDAKPAALVFQTEQQQKSTVLLVLDDFLPHSNKGPYFLIDETNRRLYYLVHGVGLLWSNASNLTAQKFPRSSHILPDWI